VILNELVLHNFGVYRGRHTLELAPPSQRKPVVLFGGLNGGGKTTLLDALQLSLFGKRARCSTRGDLAYPDFLRNSTHRKVDPADGAAVELSFSHVAEGESHEYRVHRSWTTTGSGTRERVEVQRDGTHDPVLTDTWDDQVEAFLPQELSHLFFFDGEKIKALAEPARSAELLRAAVHSLLGVDLVDRLTADLVTVERRTKGDLGSDADRAEIAKLEQDIREIEARRADLVQLRGATQNDFDRRSAHLAALEQRLRGEGGDIFESRAALEAQRDEISGELAEIESELREIAAGELPLLLVRDQLNEILADGEIEDTARRAEVLGALLADRDGQLLDRARRAGAARDVLDAMTRWLDSDREHRATSKASPRYLAMSPEQLAALRVLVDAGLPDAGAGARRKLDRGDTLHGRIVQLDRKLAMAPDRDAIAHLLEARGAAKAELDAARSRAAELDAQLASIANEENGARVRLARLLEKRVAGDFERGDVQRMMRAASDVRDAMVGFKRAVVLKHVQRIEMLVLESFRALMRKSTLVQTLSIRPDTFELELRDRDGQQIPAKRLSAGERQLLAVSVLWGLGKASGRSLPAVIDTPLGRLDSVHRRHLVERYFPKASHQVLLLSTDEEINESQLERLRPYIGRSYRLDYDESKDATDVTEGYFWQVNR
jgi:DNA sulfur modification protein DndD